MTELPPDLPRLQIIRRWLADQRARHEVIGTYLQVQAERVDAAIAAAQPPQTPGGTYRLQPMRTPPGRGTLHREECWVAGGADVSRSEVLTALRDPQTGPLIEMCEACQPGVDFSR